jgi:hypothetical protein
MPDVQDFYRFVFHPVSNDMRQALVEKLAGARLASRSSYVRKLLELEYALGSSVTVGRAKCGSCSLK